MSAIIIETEVQKKDWSTNVDPGLVAVQSNERSAMEMREVELNFMQSMELRETWSKAIDFLFVCIGFSVGLGNVWRFPYLCYKNGGGAFLIPYVCSVAVVGVPMFYLEIAIGQFMSRGGLQAWKIVPLFQGIGMTTLVIVFYLNCYYNVILGWALYYFFASFTDELPWQRCGHQWNTQNCSENFIKTVNETGRSESTLVDPVTEYWENKVLDISDGLHNLGKLKVDLVLCLLLAWMVVYACIRKGIKTSGKVVYVTATAPYFFMVILLVRNSMLDGALEGVKYYLDPDISKLSKIEVWVDAGTQIFFSCSIGLGALTAIGSYNTFSHNSYRDAVIFNIVNSLTSFLAGFIVFTSLGFMAKQQNRSIAEVAESGPGLAFIAYPKAVAQMPIAPLWSAFFFLMILLLGLDSQFSGVEGVITTFVDQYPRFLRKGQRKEVFVAFICLVTFICSLPMVTQGGMYVFQLFDYYSGSRVILLVGFCELVAISYVYGIRRFYDNVVMMVGYSWMSYSLPYLLVCWAVLSPIFCGVTFVLSAMTYTKLTYERPNGRIYHYPEWGIAIGWFMVVSSAIWIPVIAVYNFVRYGATWEVFKLLLVPYRLFDHQKRPQDVDERCLYDYLQEKKRLSQTPSQANVTYNNLGYDPDQCQIFTKL